MRSHAKRLIDYSIDFFPPDWLDDEVVDATYFGELPRFFFEVTGREKNDRRVRDLAITAQFSNEFVTMHLWHENVGNDQIGFFFADHLERFYAGVRLKQAVTEMYQHRQEKPPIDEAIIDDKNRFFRYVGGAIVA